MSTLQCSASGGEFDTSSSIYQFRLYPGFRGLDPLLSPSVYEWLINRPEAIWLETPCHRRAEVEFHDFDQRQSGRANGPPGIQGSILEVKLRDDIHVPLA
jgi:hypothetical protein